MNAKARQTTQPLLQESSQRDWTEGLAQGGRRVSKTYTSTWVPWPSTSNVKIPTVMIELVNRIICKIQSGVSVHELQVLRGYDMSGATIHDVQVWRA